MKKTLLTVAILAGFGMSALQAQFNYIFSVHTSTYAAVTSGTSVNGSTIWDDNDFSVPIGFNFALNGTPITTIEMMEQSALATSNTASVFSAFLYTDADLFDRSNANGSATPGSPITYQVSGTAPNRIGKLDINGAAFFDEYDIYGTINNYVFFQIWIYETSNVIEFHYGPSSVSHYSDYFTTVSGQPIFAFLKDVSSSTGDFDKAYYLKGNPAAPTLDTALTTYSNITAGLNAWPASGTIYRFTPKSVPTGIASFNALSNIAVYPTVAQNELFVANNEKETVNYSIVSLNGAAVDLNGALSNGKTTIDVSTLASGVYAIDLHSNTASKRVKFIKQ